MLREPRAREQGALTGPLRRENYCECRSGDGAGCWGPASSVWSIQGGREVHH